MQFQSSHAPRERAAQSARRLQHSTWAKPNRYHEAGIPNPRAVMAFTAVALVLLAVVILGAAVIA